MNAIKQATWLFVLLISLSCSGWYFATAQNPPKLDAHTLSTTTDMIINNLTVQQFDNEGQLVNYLKTPLMRHTALNNAHWFRNPYIIVKQKNQPNWEISAKQATALKGGEQITFNQNVVIHQAKDEHTLETTLRTETITYYPSKKFATTPLEVTFERPGSKVQSKGMNAYLDEKHVQLLSEARGTYEPAHS